MLFLSLIALQAIRQSTVPIDCVEKKWAKAGVPYGDPKGPPQRYLILSNGPEFMSEYSVPAKVDHVNLYWGKIPFESQDLKLRVYIDHFIDAQSTLDNLDIRFCMGIRNGGGSPVQIVRRVTTVARPPENEPHQYIDPGQDLSFAHLSQKWQASLAAGKTILIPDDSDPGDVADIGVTLKQRPENLQYGNVIAELDLHADKAIVGRSLIVRTVARKPGGTLGACLDESCAQAGAGERGWWPQADIYVRSDPNAPIKVDPKAEKPFAARFRVCTNGGVDWAMFNKFDANGLPVTNNLLDTFGTKNSGLWGVNVLYRIYYQADQVVKTPLFSSIACVLKDLAVSHVLSGPFSEKDNPWATYADAKLRVSKPGYLNFRSKMDYDYLDLGKVGSATEDVHYFEYFITDAGASVLPTDWIIQNGPRK